MPKLSAKIEGDLVKMALNIQKLDQSATKAIVHAEFDKFIQILFDFVNLKKKIKQLLLEISSATINDKKALQILRNISLGVEFQCDKYLKNISQVTEIDCSGLEQFNYEELDKIGSDIFYSWIDSTNYVEGLLKISSLFLDISIPKILDQYVEEARKCYALQQYLAVYSLCRTILETSIRDIGQRKGILPKDKGNQKYRVLRDWTHMKNKVVPQFLKDKVRKIYDRTSGLIHGRTVVNKDIAYETFKNTLKIIHQLYDFYFKAYAQTKFRN